MNRTVVVVPVRGLHGGKSRLAGILAPSQRTTIIGHMTRHVVAAVERASFADTILVVSREAQLLRNLDIDSPVIRLLHQPQDSLGLNAAIDLGRDFARRDGADRLLVLSGDLPVVQPADLHTVLATRAEVVLASDRSGTGTNALLLHGASSIERFRFHFGATSRGDHSVEAARIKSSFEVVESPGLALDLDTKEDWDMLSADVRQHILTPKHFHIDGLFDPTGKDPVALLEHA